MSVCQSVTKRYCVETAKYIIILFTPHHSSFFDNTPWQYFRKDPLTGASNAGGTNKSLFSTNSKLYHFRDKAIYCQYLALSRKWYTLLWNANRKPYASFRMVLFLMTLSDLEWLRKIFNDTTAELVVAIAICTTTGNFEICARQIFTARCVHIMRIMPWQDVWSSVCLSVTCRHCVETAEHIKSKETCQTCWDG